MKKDLSLIGILIGTSLFVYLLFCMLADSGTTKECLYCISHFEWYCHPWNHPWLALAIASLDVCILGLIGYFGDNK